MPTSSTATTIRELPRGCLDEHEITICPSSGNAVFALRRTEPLDLSAFTACEPDSERTEWFILQFSTRALQDIVHGSPRSDMLLNLVQFNATRALVMNARVMGITREFMVPDARSQIAYQNFDGAVLSSVPLSLKPTCLQLTVSHHPWIDVLPWSEIRDNLLRRDENSYDKKELCRGLRGFQAVAGGWGGIIVWGDPWDPLGWEVTEAFASQWPWGVKNCHKVLESTRYWRAVGGEAQ